MVAGLVLVLLGCAPLAASLLANAVAHANGCLADGLSPHPCVVLGGDRGGLLYALGLAMFLFAFTFWLIPVGGAVFLAGVAIGVVGRLCRP